MQTEKDLKAAVSILTDAVGALASALQNQVAPQPITQPEDLTQDIASLASATSQIQSLTASLTPTPQTPAPAPQPVGPSAPPPPAPATSNDASKPARPS